MENNNNSNNKILVNGLYFKLPHINAPEFVKGKLSITVNEFVQFINNNQKNGYINIDLLVSKAGAPYAILDTWEPNQDNTNINNTPTPQVTKQPIEQQQEMDTKSDEEINIENIPF